METKLLGGQRKKALNDVHIAALQKNIDDDCSISLELLRDNLKNDFNIDVCTMTIHRYIKSFNYTVKKTTLIPIKRNDERAINAREEYANAFFNLLSDLDESRLYFVDEVGFNVTMRCRHGRSLRGTNAVQVVPGLRSRNISVCCAITKHGVAIYNAQTTAYNTFTFTSFITSLLSFIKTENRGKSGIIMDNVPFHKHHGIKEMIENEGHIVVYLPPYSPFLNPIENMFAKWKQSIRRERPENETRLFELIENIKLTISEDDCSGFYRNMLGFLPKCLKRETIIES